MIYLITGVPGASKTLNAIKFISEDSTFKDREVYYHNVKELTLPWAKLETDDDAKNWASLPDGSVVLLDECQGIFPQRGAKGAVPEYISLLNTHRHRGFDFVIVTQHPKLIDVAVRRLVGCHYHFERAFGFNRARRLHWQECIDDPKDYHARQQAITKSVKFDKKYYGVYKSAETHTHKAKIPPKLIALGVLILCVAAGIFHFITNLQSRYQTPDVAVSDVSGALSDIGKKVVTSDSAFQPAYPIDPQEYMELFKPRVEGLAHTAPIYDELTKPQRAPKTICVRHHKANVKHCKCFSEQGTKLSVPLNMCNSIVDNGLYDPTLPPDGSRSARQRRESPVINRVPEQQSSNYYSLAPTTKPLPSDDLLPDPNITSSGRLLPDTARSVASRVQPTDLPPLKVSIM